MRDPRPAREALADRPAGWALAALGLGGFTVAQPLYDLLRRFPGFFVAHRATPGDLLALASTLSVLVPLAAALPALVLAVWTRRGGRVAFAVTVGLFLALAAAQVLVGAGAADWPLGVAAPLALAVAGAVLWLRRPAVRRATLALAVAAPVFPALFLASPVLRGLYAAAPWESAGRVPPSVDTPAVLFVLDELPLATLLDGEERIDGGLFPHFAALARDGVWYRQATTVAESTPYAVPAILSGRYPHAEELLPTAADYPRNLFTLLGGSYNLHVVEAVTQLCPEELCAGDLARPGAARRRLAQLADAAAILLHLVTAPGAPWEAPELDDRWRDFWDLGLLEPPPVGSEDAGRAPGARWRRQGEIFDRFVADLDRFPPPTFHYLHLLLPHAPWQTVPGGHSYQGRRNTGAERDRERGDFRWVGTPLEIARGLQRHVLQVGFVDRLLGRLVARLRELELYDRALIVVVADHGAAFRRGYSTRHTGAELPTLVDIANVPLLVKYPFGRLRGVDDANRETIDIAPTVLDALRVGRGDLALDGQALDGPAPERAEKRLYPSWGRRSQRGEPVRFPPSRLAERRDFVRFKLQYLGAGSWQRVFALGPHEEWVGRPADSLPAADAVSARLDDERLFRAVDPDSSFLPLSIAGEVQGPGRGPRWLAIVVNGRVAAVTETTHHRGRERFAAVISPAFFRPGGNDVSVRGFAAGAITPTTSASPPSRPPG